MTKKIAPTHWLPEMEGFRGFASLWVFLGHICILTNCNIPLIGKPSYGVDLFVLLSGFLMTKNYIERREIEKWNSRNTFIKFYIRRFFRIAPLYYLLLIIAILSGPFMGGMRDIITSHYPFTATDTSRFNDQSLSNFLIHISLLFGLLPDYSFRTVLPDWSIGLEIQYYLIFPFIMLICSRVNIILALTVISALSTIMYFMFPEFFMSFAMPSFILIKLPIFIAGMICSIAEKKQSRITLIFAIFTIAVASLTRIHINHTQLAIQIFMVIFIFEVVRKKNTFKIIKLSKEILSSKFSMWLGDVSYSVYLIHLLIVTPLIGFLLKNTSVPDFNPILRFLMVTIISAPIVYTLSTISFKYIEKSGVKLGKKIIR